MSLVKIQGNASGTGIFTIASPNSNTNRTLTLPDSSGTLALAGSSLTGVTDSASPFETALGTGAGGSNTGTNNTFVGYNAGTASTTGAYNTALGTNALKSNTTAGDSTAIGAGALETSTGQSNTAVGAYSLNLNSTGTFNTAVGRLSLYANTTGGDNTAVGYAALDANTTGIQNTAVGSGALGANTTSVGNTAVGYQALLANTANNNTGVGRNALGSNTTGTSNTGLGFYALVTNTTGSNNTALGNAALEANSTGLRNSGVGDGALTKCTTGSYNSGFGEAALNDLTTGSGNVQIGARNSSGTYAPVFTVTTENNRLVAGSTGVTNAYVQVAWTVVSDARDKTNIQPVPHGLSFVNQLNPVSFQFKMSREDETPNGNKRYGFLAQDILALEGDDPVIIDNEVPEKLKYQGESLVPVLVKAIQELKAINDAQATRIETLETKVAALEAK